MSSLRDNPRTLGPRMQLPRERQTVHRDKNRRNRLAHWIGRVLANMLPEPGSECIRWGGYINKVNGYGQCRVSKFYDGMEYEDGTSPAVTGAHRVTYSLFRGPIPDGMHLDHGDGCENRWCVNPYHTVAMWQSENARLANLRRWHGHRGEAPEAIEELEEDPWNTPEEDSVFYA